MTKQELQQTILADLLAFNAACSEKNVPTLLPEFETFFRNRENDVGLKKAIIQATGISPLATRVVSKYLSSLPGIECAVEDNKEILRVSVADAEAALRHPVEDDAGRENDLLPSKPASPDDETSAWVVPDEFAAQYKKAVEYITVHRTWFEDVDAMNEIRRQLDWIGKIAPGRLQSAKAVAEAGERIAVILKKAGDGTFLHDREAKNRLLGKLAKLHASPNEMEKFEREFARGKALWHLRRKGEQTDPPVSGLPPPDFDVNDPNPFFLGNLVPSRRWTVLIDETGDLFDASAIEPGKTEETKRGKMVALLVPQGSSLRRLAGGEHATDDTKDDVEERLGNLFATHPRCGVLGITLEGMPKVSAAAVNYWYAALERCFDLVLRLTPTNGKGRTTFKFLVEARCAPMFLDSQSRMVERTLHSSLCRLARANPSLESRIETSVSVEHKKQTFAGGDFAAWNGYVDSLANAWNGVREELKADLKAYGLPGICLLDGKTQNLTAAMDALDSGDPVSAEQWSELLSSTKTDGTDSLPAVTLGKFAERVKKDERLWTELVRDTKSRLDSHDVRLRDLRTRIDWLENNKPDGARLPKRLELLWLVVRLANANHHGATEAQLKDAKIDMARFRRLVDELFEEDAPLVSWATLHLAVLATDSFEFAKARRIVRDFLALAAKKQAERGFFARIKERLAGIPSDPVLAANPAVMGLRYHSELISSLGQHAAFEGDNITAVKLFRQAIEGFARLSEEKLRMKEIGKTRAYLATAAMDAKDVSDDELRQIVRDYLGKDPVEAASKLSSSEDVKDYYCHHILLRYIVSGRAPAEVGTNYLTGKRNWTHVLDGHPWELIEFYRSILVDDPVEKANLLRRAVANCRDRGLTLQVIGCVILNALAQLDSSAIDEYRRNLDEIRKGLPSLGAKRLAALERAAESPVDPLKLAKAVLPFNFR